MDAVTERRDKTLVSLHSETWQRGDPARIVLAIAVRMEIVQAQN
ncbi:MAG TPA: hypothetical protein VIX73_12040 [Kofleriaceae bacterium]|jgi:hypothetical protein